ncbi:MAG: DUF1638 domain-containing protein [Coriobacteriales bacterium]|jgi:hypothetical protein|nr:DUF1638 domain-containing protein [Coriobacteriales bacterium]
MKTAILACKTIREELLLAESRVNSGYEIHWVESNLHNVPEKLTEGIQVLLDQLDDYDRVLLAFGFCGGSVAGIRTHSFDLYVPRIDDCISLMIGSIKQRELLSEGHRSIYLTKGWLDHESNIWSEYQYSVDKFGEKTAQYVIESMFGNYDWLSLIDTGAYDITTIFEQADQIAERFGMERVVIPGTVAYFEQLLTGPYDEKLFLHVQPHSLLTADELVLNTEDQKSAESYAIC